MKKSVIFLFLFFLFCIANTFAQTGEWEDLRNRSADRAESASRSGERRSAAEKSDYAELADGFLYRSGAARGESGR